MKSATPLVCGIRRIISKKVRFGVNSGARRSISTFVRRSVVPSRTTGRGAGVGLRSPNVPASCSTSAVVLQLQPSMRLEHISDSVIDFTGCSAAEYAAKPRLWLGAVDPRDRQLMLSAFNAAPDRIIDYNEPAVPHARR